MSMIKIPQDLFMDLVKYHLGGLTDPEITDRINVGLYKKLDAIARRNEYAKSHKPRSLQ